jgi:hypothetical protein
MKGPTGARHGERLRVRLEADALLRARGHRASGRVTGEEAGEPAAPPASSLRHLGRRFRQACAPVDGPQLAAAAAAAGDALQVGIAGHLAVKVCEQKVLRRCGGPVSAPVPWPATPCSKMFPWPRTGPAAVSAANSSSSAQQSSVWGRAASLKAGNARLAVRCTSFSELPGGTSTSRLSVPTATRSLSADGVPQAIGACERRCDSWVAVRRGTSPNQQCLTTKRHPPIALTVRRSAAQTAC